MKKIVLLVLSLFIFQVTNAQTEDEKWVIGVGAGLAKYKSSDINFIGDQILLQVPRLNISRYLFKGITLDGAVSISSIKKIEGVFTNNTTYFSLDGSARYDFNTSEDNIVPYLLVGGSFVKSKKLTPTINFGGGNTVWFLPHYGINLQVMYKYSANSYESQRSHLYFSAGLVYSFKKRFMVPTLWK